MRLVLRTALLGGTILSASVGLSSIVHAGCVDGSNGTVCSNGSSNSSLVYTNHNPIYVAGDFVLNLESYEVLGGGISLSGTDGHSSVILDSNSKVLGAVPASFSAAGIFVQGVDNKNISVDLLGSSTVDSTANGILVTNGGFSPADISVTTNGGAVFGRSDFGIHASALGADINIHTKGEVFGGLGGILASSTLGRVDVVTEDKVSGVGYWGLWASSIFDVSVVTSGDVTGTQGLVATGSSGVTNIITAGGTLIEGTSGSGLIAQGGSVFVDAASDIIGSDTGLAALAFSGASTINTSGQIEGVAGFGILASSNSFSATDTLSIIANGKVTGGIDGIRAFTLFSNDVTINADAEITGKIGNGITGLSDQGDISIFAGVNSRVIGAVGGIEASSGQGGLVSVTNLGLVQGTDFGVFAESTSGITIDNSGTIENLSGAVTDYAALSLGSAAVISNAVTGIINGRIGTDNSADVLNNSGLWRTGGFNHFGGGFDILTNSGTLQFGNVAGVAEAAIFDGLEQTTNSGLISSLDQNQGDNSSNFDSLTFSGDYVGQAGAAFGLDAFLDGPRSLADSISIIGNVSGSTGIVVNNTNSLPGGVNTDGIVLIDAFGSANSSNFFLVGGPVASGFLSYDLNFQVRPDRYSFALISGPSLSASQTIAAVDAAQGLWQTGAEAWSQQQNDLRDRASSKIKIVAVADPALPEEVPDNAIWTRIRGDWLKRESLSEVNLLGTTRADPLAYSQNTFGVDAGVDFVAELDADKRALFGIVAGYQTSQLGFDNSGDGVEFKGLSIGAHASLVAHDFFLNAIAKHDWLTADYTIAGAGSARSDAYTFGARGDFGYRLRTGNGYIEPMVSLASSSTAFNDFVFGIGTVEPGRNVSTRIGAGARFGASDGNLALSWTARVWKGIGDGNSINLAGPTFDMAIASPGINDGLVGELSGALNYQLGPQSNVFMGGSMVFGDDVAAHTANAGILINW